MKKNVNRSLAYSLSMYLFMLLAAIFVLLAAGIGGIWFYGLRRQIRENGRQAAETSASRINDILIRAQTAAQTLASSLEMTEPDAGSEAAMLAQALQELYAAAPEIVELEVIHEPREGSAGFSLTASMENGVLTQETQEGLSDRYLQQNWYGLPKSLQRGLWTPPQPDGRSVAYSTPFFCRSGNVCGVVSIRLELRRMRPLLGAAGLDGIGYGFLLSQFGQIVIHPVQKLELKRSLPGLLTKYGSLLDRERGYAILQTRSGSNSFEQWSLFPGGTELYHATCINGWKVCVAVPSEWAFYQVIRLLCIGALCWCAIMLTAGIGIWVLTRRISLPLTRLAEAAEAIGHGDFQHELPAVRSADEVGSLNRSFRAMQRALMRYVAQLEQNIVARERMEGELDAAHSIQNDILPKMRPPLPENSDFSIAPVLCPARIIGGDLYDVFLRDPNHLVILIGDVAGKGVPAALFMAVAQTLHRNLASAGGTPGEIITRLNELLAENNNSMMFLTCWLGVLEISTGRMRYCNAGHNPPLLLRAGGRCEPVTTLHGAPLGIVNAEYKDSELTMKTHDVLLLYTDGVTEAFAPNDEMYGEERLKTLASRLRADNVPPAKMRDRILKEVTDFSDGREQSDDITLLVMRYNRKIASELSW